MARFDEGRRFNEERQFSDDADILSCTNKDDDINCLSTQGAFHQCLADNSDSQASFQSCLQNSCPNTSSEVIQCLANPTDGTGVIVRRHGVETAPRD